MNKNEKKQHLREYRLQQMRIVRMTEVIRKYPNEAARCRQNIRDAWKVREHIEDEIAAVEDTTLREVLAQKYLSGRTLGEIAEYMNYSKRQIERLHVKALDVFEIAS